MSFAICAAKFMPNAIRSTKSAMIWKSKWQSLIQRSKTSRLKLWISAEVRPFFWYLDTYFQHLFNFELLQSFPLVILSWKPLWRWSIVRIFLVTNQILTLFFKANSRSPHSERSKCPLIKCCRLCWASRVAESRIFAAIWRRPRSKCHTTLQKKNTCTIPPFRVLYW